MDSSNAAPRRLRFDPAFATVTTLFFVWGFVTSLNDTLVPSVRAVFHLSYTESMLTQFAFFFAYGVVSLPAAAALARLGYARTIIASLAAMVVGCLMIPLATNAGSYWFVLAALFVIAAGITQLQVAANPLAALLGDPARSHFRLTLSQAINSLGTVLGPILGSYLILRSGVFAGAGAAARSETLAHLGWQFLLIAGIVIALGIFLWHERARLKVRQTPEEPDASPLLAFASGWACFGAVAIFLYVGAEVSIGSVMINFLHENNVLDVSYAEAGRLLSLYWGGAMVGRAVGSLVLLRAPAARVLACAAGIAVLLCLAVTQMSGMTVGIAALAIGLFNSVMFPTIFTLTLERSSAPTASTSGLLCMAIVGGAILPLCCGYVADHASLAEAFFVPLAAYIFIAVFALSKPSVTAEEDVSAPIAP